MSRIFDARAKERFFAHRLAPIGALVLAAVAALVLFAPLVCFVLGVDPYTPAPDLLYAPPSAAHPFGTDDLGRDVLARLLYGGRISLVVAIVSTFVSIAAGGAIGLAAGYFGGALDTILMRFTEVMMSVPRLPLMLILAAADLGKIFGDPELTRGSAASVVKVILVIVIFGWMPAARLARASALQIRETGFVASARALGASDARIIGTHVLPNAASPLIVAATLEAGEIIVYESVLSFLGLGVAPPIPSWGAMLANGFSYLYSAPQLLVLPGLFTFLTVAGLGLLGDGLRRALDPR